MAEFKKVLILSRSEYFAHEGNESEDRHVTIIRSRLQYGDGLAAGELGSGELGDNGAGYACGEGQESDNRYLNGAGYGQGYGIVPILMD